MKLNSVLIFLLILGQGKAIAQDKRELDWKDFSQSISNTVVSDPVRFGKFTIFKIVNINKFLYKVEMEGRAFELETPIPTELQTLFRLTPTELSKTVNNESSQKGLGEIKKATEPMQELNKKLINVVKEEKDIDKKMSTTDIQEMISEVVEECRKYTELATKVSEDIFNLKRLRNQLVVIAQLDMEYKEILQKVEQLDFNESGVVGRYAEMKTKYNDVEALYERVKYKLTDNEEMKEEMAIVTKALARLEKGDELIDEDALLGVLNEVNYLYHELQNPKNFVVTAPPVQMDGDMVTYTVSIMPTVTKTVGAFRNPIKFQFDVPTKGGWKVDFSVGPALSFGKGSRDEKYYFEDIANGDSVIIRERENRNKISPGIAAQMHVYNRRGGSFNWGGMFGVGAGFQTVQDVDLSLYTGLSVILGKRQKVIGSIGIGWLRVDRLKTPEYKTDNRYDITKVILGDITEKVFRQSAFISISYNLANKVESK